MGVSTAISVEEYLRTSFLDLDREYLDGELHERTLPEFLHGKTQALLVAFFLLLRGRFKTIYPCVETRMKLAANCVLIPDVAVFYGAEPGPLPETPPLIVVEVLSPDDRLNAVREKLQQYKAWGVTHVWLADPHSRRLYTCDAGLTEVAQFEVPDLHIKVLPSDIFDWA